MQYELMYIVPATFTDDDVGRIEGDVKTLLEKQGASLKDAKRLGKFRFTYPIKNVRHGHYFLTQFETEPSSVAKIDEGLRLSSEVLRHLILRAEEAGGDKFDLVQFVEVNIEAKEDKPRRKRDEKPAESKEKASEDIKSGVAALEAKPEEEGNAAKASAALSDEELDKKLSAALEGDAKEA